MERATKAREWLELAAELLSAPLTQLPERQLADQLQATFALRGTAFHYRDPGCGPVQRMWPADEQFDGYRAEIEYWGVHSAPAQHPLLRYYLMTGDWRPMHVWDVPEPFAPPAVLGHWCEVARPWGATSQLALPLHSGPQSHRAFVLGRADPFTPGEVHLAATLQRLLRGLDRQIGYLGDRTDGPAREVATSLRLTPREHAVLGLLADGLTAAAIGRRLLITERTVHKHLERIYAKIGVGDRLGAVLRAQRLGLLTVR